MKLKLVRKWKKEGYTIGQLYVDGVFFSNKIEDKDIINNLLNKLKGVNDE